jgi:hypothetical protein
MASGLLACVRDPAQSRASGVAHAVSALSHRGGCCGHATVVAGRTLGVGVGEGGVRRRYHRRGAVRPRAPAWHRCAGNRPRLRHVGTVRHRSARAPRGVGARPLGAARVRRRAHGRLPPSSRIRDARGRRVRERRARARRTGARHRAGAARASQRIEARRSGSAAATPWHVGRRPSNSADAIYCRFQKPGPTARQACPLPARAPTGARSTRQAAPNSEEERKT